MDHDFEQESFGVDKQVAQPLVERALAIREQILEGHHPETAAALFVLAAVREAQGQLHEAAILYQRALAVCEYAYGPTHPATTDIRSKLQVVWHILDTGEAVTAPDDVPPRPALT